MLCKNELERDVVSMVEGRSSEPLKRPRTAAKRTDGFALALCIAIAPPDEFDEFGKIQNLANDCLRPVK